MVFSTIDISRVIIALKELTIGSLDPKTSTKRSVESVLTNTLSKYVDSYVDYLLMMSSS